jgi:hypothetical protein
MIWRLILVGVVGVLGIPLSGGADWKIDLTCARTGPTAGDHPTQRFADERNPCSSKGADLPSAPTLPAATIPRDVAMESSKAIDDLFAENQVWSAPAAQVENASDAAAERLFAENGVWAEALAEAATEPAKAVEPLFADNDDWCEPQTQVVIESERAVDPLFAENDVRSEPAAEAVIESDKAVEVLFAKNDVWREPAVETVAANSPPVEEPPPTFEPTEMDDVTCCLVDDGNVADEMNGDSQSPSIAQNAEPDIKTALGLTRDAALAWMNVLTKTMTAPSDSR